MSQSGYELCRNRYNSMANTLVFHFKKLSIQRPISGHKVFLSRQFSQNVVDSKIKLRRALENYKDLDLRFIRITGHGYGTSFSNTPLRYRRLKVPDDANVILETKFSTVFSTGFQGLKNYVYNNVLETSESHLPLCPLTALSVFVTELRKYHQCFTVSCSIKVHEYEDSLF